VGTFVGTLTARLARTASTVDTRNTAFMLAPRSASTINLD
jgi:hypothetical protein